MLKKILFLLALPMITTLSMIATTSKNSSIIIPTKTAHNLVEICTVNANIVLDIRYATQNNFSKIAVYPSARCFVLTQVAAALNAIQKKLESQGLGLKIYDGYRPMAIQQKFWDLIQDERYVSNPAVNKGRHTRGTAVDVTLIEKYIDESGFKKTRELDMPTEFDDFTPKAFANAKKGLTPVQIKNRNRLKSIMEKYGFKNHPYEWWHFDWCNGNKDRWKNFPPLNILFNDL